MSRRRLFLILFFGSWKRYFLWTIFKHVTLDLYHGCLSICYRPTCERDRGVKCDAGSINTPPPSPTPLVPLDIIITPPVTLLSTLPTHPPAFLRQTTFTTFRKMDTFKGKYERTSADKYEELLKVSDGRY